MWQDTIFGSLFHKMELRLSIDLLVLVAIDGDDLNWKTSSSDWN